MKLKLIAVTEKGYRQYFKALVELDQYTLQKFTRGGEARIQYQGDDVVVGQEIDISPIIRRLEDLEEREQNMRQLCELLAKFLPDFVKPEQLEKLREELRSPQNEPAPLQT